MLNPEHPQLRRSARLAGNQEHGLEESSQRDQGIREAEAEEHSLARGFEEHDTREEVQRLSTEQSETQGSEHAQHVRREQIEQIEAAEQQLQLLGSINLESTMPRESKIQQEEALRAKKLAPLQSRILALRREKLTKLSQAAPVGLRASFHWRNGQTHDGVVKQISLTDLPPDKARQHRWWLVKYDDGDELWMNIGDPSLKEWLSSLRSNGGFGNTC